MPLLRLVYLHPYPLHLCGIFLPWARPLISGSAITSILIVSAVVQYFARSIPAYKCLNYGLITLIASLGILALCMLFQLSAFFFISDFLVGVGHGLTLIGSFGLIHAMTSLENRAAGDVDLSFYWLFGYDCAYCSCGLSGRSLWIKFRVH